MIANLTNQISSELRSSFRLTVFVPTKEDWYPSYRVGNPEEYKHHFQYHTYLLRVNLIMLDSNTFRVCVWGADDKGMEKDFDSLDEAISQYFTIITQKWLTQSFLEASGFLHA